MCGRFTLVTAPEKPMSRFQLQEFPFDLKPWFNIALGQPIPAILADCGHRRIVFRKSEIQRIAADLCIGTANAEDYDDLTPDSAFRSR
ncbi:hypothetical protein [Brevibacillus borstelensis]|jgi:putative SOS response-associated peptidase YedK|uniref:hypothetical protein n=1 Tax=Brevibacillus borstelensis TaxID=45462 RepID=UPI002E1A7F08|nr:hypothetical protein [Brevibacillus borstelensis]MED1876400.1 hypothetical protein [Brevibacillus borstelensis]